MEAWSIAGVNLENGCNQVQIQFSMDTYWSEAKVELLSDIKVA